MPSQYFDNIGPFSREQILLEDMIIESIHNHGIAVYYLPRTSQSELDTLFGEDPVKYYDRAYKIDMYLETFQDYGGQQEFFSKFGLQIEKTARMAVARRTFNRYIPQSIRTIPFEGDLIYMPIQRKLMEIRFVERDISFFQLGKVEPYMYALSLETFKYNGELLNTGIEEVDVVADESAMSTDYYVSNTSYGSANSFTRFEVAYQGTDVASASALGIVVSFDRPTGTLRLRNVKGAFSNTGANTITGNTSMATANVIGGNIMLNATIPQGDIGDNVLIENESNNVLDFSEQNPFGDP
jgi:Virus neck protein